MKIWLYLLLAVGLAADAVTVSVANGIAYPRKNLRLALGCGLAFGFFQAVMPLVGYLAGSSFLHLISEVDHWIAMGLLGVIGGRMIWEAVRELRSGEESKGGGRFALKTLVLQAFATSVDALAVGIGLGVLGVNIAAACAVIGVVTFAGSFAGVLAGRMAGRRFCGRAQLAGGCVLVLIGLHILAEHLHLFP